MRPKIDGKEINDERAVASMVGAAVGNVTGK